MAKAKQVVWVIMHYEYMGLADMPWVDAIQFHVASTLVRAEKYIRGAGVSSHSWWQVHPHVVDGDDPDEGDDVYYFSHRGTPLKSAPHARTLAAFRRHAARYPDQYPNSRGSDQA